MPRVLQSCAHSSITVPDAGVNENYVIPAWAVEAAASAPPVPAADAGPLIAIFRAARAAA